MTFFKGGSAVVEAEGELLRLHEIPSVRMARAAVLEKIHARDEAEQVMNGLPRDEVSLTSLQARQTLRDADVAVKGAEKIRDKLHEAERLRILEARKPGRRGLIAKIDAALEVVRQCNNDLTVFDLETAALIERPYPHDGELGVFVPATDETPSAQTYLSAWRARLREDHWLS